MHRSSLKGKHAPPPYSYPPAHAACQKANPISHAVLAKQITRSLTSQEWPNNYRHSSEPTQPNPTPTHPDITQFAWKSIFGGDKRQAISAAQTTKGNGRQKPRPQRDFKVTSRISRPLGCLKTAGQGEWVVWMA